MEYDKIIIGCGLYGMYAALFCAKNNENILVLEAEKEPLIRATLANQARVHMGYHYPRSLETAVKSKGYFDRFNKDFDYCINSKFKKVYATSSIYSWTNKEQFIKFCKDADIYCEVEDVNKYFNEGLCDGAYDTVEYAYDAEILKNKLVEDAKKYKNIKIKYNTYVTSIKKEDGFYVINDKYKSKFVLNATYASVNQIQHMAGFEPFPIKYELCEIILCKVSDNLKDIGITVMDGPFFSIMPFGETGLHSLTSVTFTPHTTSYDKLPTFSCQSKSDGYCSPELLGDCNQCKVRPKSAWPYMSTLARKYLKPEYKFEYAGSLFSMKPILKASEIDDSRPTVIKKLSENPTFVSVLSGKINTIYDMDEVLKND